MQKVAMQKVSHKKYKRWRYKNTLALAVSFVLIFILMKSSYVDQVTDHIGSLGYLGAFIAGMLYVYTFTVVPAAIILYHLAKHLDPILIALVAGVGGVIGDYAIFRFLRDRVFEEFKPVFMKLGGNYVSRLHATPYFGWMSSILGAILIASPFPDEIGISLMGISKIRNLQFVLLTLFLDIVSILIIVGFAHHTGA